MAKKVIGSFKLQLKAGQATMAPPVGPAFGQRGLSGIEFVKQFNARTAKEGDTIIPAVITYYSDKSFTFELKSPPAPVLIMKALGLKGGSPEPNRNKVGHLTDAQVEEIAKTKLKDLNCSTIESAKNLIKGSARSMGVTCD